MGLYGAGLHGPLRGYIPPAVRKLNDFRDFFKGGKVEKKSNMH